MPWSGTAGAQVFTRVMGVSAFDGATCWEQTDAAGRGIRSDDHDYHDEDIAQGVNLCLHRGGGNAAYGNIPMNGFKFTGMGAGAAATDSVRMDQLESGVLTVRGDMLYRNATRPARLPKGGIGTFLTMGANDPYWTAVGTATYYNIGTAGHTIPFLDNVNTWSQPQISDMFTGAGVNKYYRRSGSGPTSTPNTYFNVGVNAGTSGSQAWTWFVVNDVTVVGSIGSTVGNFVGNPSGSTVFAESSDGRLKPVELRRQIHNSGEIIDHLNPIYYRWGAGADERSGFVAQELHKVVPSVVVKGDDAPVFTHKLPTNGGSMPWQMQYGRMEPIIVAELKALRVRVAELEAHVAA